MCGSRLWRSKRDKRVKTRWKDLKSHLWYAHFSTLVATPFPTKPRTRIYEKFPRRAPEFGALSAARLACGHIMYCILSVCVSLVESAILSSVQFWAFFKMSDFGFPSSSSSNSSSGLHGTQRAELMEQVKSQLLVASLQELLSVRHDLNTRALQGWFDLHKTGLDPNFVY